MEKELNIEEKFQSMSEIEHVLARPGMYIGNIHSELRKKYLLYKPSENKIVEVENVLYNAGILKLFDEVFTNSIDERRRKSKLFHIDEINVHIAKNGTIIISDNGGIPVVIHKELNVYLPKMIFGLLRTSSNYTSDRDGAGINGIGSKLTNIYSKYFRVTTSDSKKCIDIQWSGNMQKIDFEKVTEIKDNSHGSRFEFQLDLERFNLESLDMSTIRIIQKRCIDGAAGNIGLKINFSTDIADGALDSTWQFESFEDFVNLHIDKTKIQKLRYSMFDEIILIPTLGYDYGFVNGAVCSEGKHINKILDQVVTKILAILKTKEIELITERDIINKISVFCSVSLVNPDYDSQTKTKLTSKIASDKIKLSKQFLDSIETSVIIDDLIDFYNIKYLADQKKQLKKLNGILKTTKSKKLMDCSNKNGTNNQLWLFEGTSASNGFDSYRDPQTMACYQLRGKVKNTLNLTKEEIVNNIELREIIATLGLQFNDPKGNIKNCKFKRIVIATDMDFDGDHICGLLITFFAKNFPELFLDNRIFRAISPIIIASKGDNELYYYKQEDFEKDKLLKLKGWDIAYIKGLGSLQNHHYDQMLNNQRLIKFEILDKNYMDTIRVWFDKSTTLRKEILLSEANSLDEIEIE